MRHGRRGVRARSGDGAGKNTPIEAGAERGAERQEGLKMRPRVDELEAIVRRRICAICEFRKVEEACSHEEPGRCSLFELFPLVAQAIAATDSDNIEDYRNAIRENVCSVCIDQTLDGSCERREKACALDGYLEQIVEAVEEATGRRLNRGTAVH
jgi:hypothetical protein